MLTGGQAGIINLCTAKPRPPLSHVHTTQAPKACGRLYVNDFFLTGLHSALRGGQDKMKTAAFAAPMKSQKLVLIHNHRAPGASHLKRLQRVRAPESTLSHHGWAERGFYTECTQTEGESIHCKSKRRGSWRNKNAPSPENAPRDRKYEKQNVCTTISHPYTSTLHRFTGYRGCPARARWTRTAP